MSEGGVGLLTSAFPPCDSTVFLLNGGHSNKMPSCSRDQPSPDVESTGASILDFWVSRSVRNILLLCVNYPVSGIPYSHTNRLRGKECPGGDVGLEEAQCPLSTSRVLGKPLASSLHTWAIPGQLGGAPPLTDKSYTWPCKPMHSGSGAVTPAASV